MSDLLRNEEKHPSQSTRPTRPWKVAVLANIKEHDKPLPEGTAPDAGSDFDYIETVDQIRAAIETDGHKTLFIQADANLPFELKKHKPDICFNIAEGLGRRRTRSANPCPAGVV